MLPGVLLPGVSWSKSVKKETMEVGSLVMFVDKGRYAKWFFGRLAEVTNYTPKRVNGRASCRVKWLEPLKYHDRYTSISDFSADHFEVI